MAIDINKTSNFIISVVLLFMIFISCSKDIKDSHVDNPVKETELVLPISEPSGLSFSIDGKSLLTVSDQTGKIYRISFEGVLLETLQYNGTDPEGITVNANTEEILIAEERSRNIISTGMQGNTIKKYHLDIEENEVNSGLEGITYNSGNNHIYLLNEKKPGLLLELDEKYTLIKKTKLDFASDYSGIFYDIREDVLWIVSDQSKTINKCKTNGTLIKSYRLTERKAEGIVVNSEKKIIYVVFDKSNKLKIFKYKD